MQTDVARSDGLGLYLAKSAALAAGGTVSLRSTTGTDSECSTVFQVVIPAYLAKQSEVKASASTPQRNIVVASNSTSRHMALGPAGVLHGLGKAVVSGDGAADEIISGTGSPTQTHPSAISRNFDSLGDRSLKCIGIDDEPLARLQLQAIFAALRADRQESYVLGPTPLAAISCPPDI